MSIRLSLLAVVGAVLAASSASATPYDFTPLAGDRLPTTFDGATFSSTAGNHYVFGPNSGLFSTLAPTVLSEGGFSGAPLTITFSAPVTSYSLHFALGDFFGIGGDDFLTVTPSGGDFAAQRYASSIPGSDDYPQGVVSATGVDITSLTLTSAYAIVISNLVTTSASVPEPLSIAVLGAGLVGLFGARRRG
jgi:hypothetical protein